MRTLFCFMLWAGSVAGQTASTANKPVCQLTTTEIKQGYCCARGGVQQDCPTILFERDIVRESAHKPEPIDVPANGYRCTLPGAKSAPIPECAKHTMYTCADKSRILLTAEDGKKYCHKPQTGSAQ